MELGNASVPILEIGTASLCMGVRGVRTSPRQPKALGGTYPNFLGFVIFSPYVLNFSFFTKLQNKMTQIRGNDILSEVN